MTAGSGYCEQAGKSANKSPDYRELRVFRQVLDIVERNYVKDVSEQQLIQGAISGMLQSLDPHSSYLTEEMFKEFKTEFSSQFGGLGIEITMENRHPDGGVLPSRIRLRTRPVLNLVTKLSK